MFLKILVRTNSEIWILTTAQLIALVYAIYFWLVICRIPENYVFLGALTQSFVVGPIYLTVRCHVTDTTHLRSFLNGASALVTYMVTIGNVTAGLLQVAGSIELGSSMLCDIVISAALVWLLRGSKQNSFKRTRNAIDKLVLYSVNIGPFDKWLAAPEDNFIFAIFHFSLGKIYVNSMLVSLNARDKIRNEMMSNAYVAPSMFDVDGVGATAPKTIPLGRIGGKV
ncbi:hypothetical protein DL96DRAFT_1625388 [Flagelloscypha sp. PMI_526]|nr:hypothetical protein DL96DRAFT_1625388 [Flagelloscypha sp. PMI_526]